MTAGDLSADRQPQQNISREVSGPTPYAKRNVFAGSPANAWRFLVDNFSKTYYNMQLQKPIANYIIRRFILLLKNWKLSSLSCMHEALQTKVIYCARYLD